MYHYRECGLRNVWLANGFDEHDTPYGPGIAIHLGDEAAAFALLYTPTSEEEYQL